MCNRIECFVPVVVVEDVDVGGEVGGVDPVGSPVTPDLHREPQVSQEEVQPRN
jgi:hypothetical protein